MVCYDLDLLRNETFWDLAGCGVGDSQAAEIAQVLKLNGGVKGLKLAGNCIGVPGAKAFADALQGKTKFDFLHLNDMKLGDDAAVALAKALEGKPSFKYLCMRGNDLGVKGAEAFATALQGNTSLEVLDLTSNHIGVKGAEAFAKALEGNTTLRLLYLRNNEIGVQGLKALTSALKSNRMLNLLSIKGNKIKDEGAQLLAGALSKFKSLKRLYLNNNGITLAGARAFATALEGGASLQELDFKDNDIGLEGAETLVKALEGNKSLQFFDFTAPKHASPDLLSRVQKAVERNKKDIPKSEVATSSTQQYSPADELQHEKKSPLLDRPIQSLQVSYPCVLAWLCPGHTVNLDDNERGPCGLHLCCIQCKHSQAVSDAGLEQLDTMSLRDFYYANRSGGQCPSCQSNIVPLQLHVVCHYCKRNPPEFVGPAHERPSFTVNCSDTIQAFYLHLREIVCNDLKSFHPAYPNFEELKKAGIRAEPMELCHLLSNFNQLAQNGSAISDDNIKKIAASLQDPKGVLRKKLEEKMNTGGKSTYIRIGLVHQLCFGQHTAVLELWPEGHASPIHQHGGCAGAIYVVSGKLQVEVFRSLVDQTVVADSTIGKGYYAFMDRVNFSTHRVKAVVEKGDKYRFALSIHLYKSCTDEFEFIRNGVAQKRNPNNDFVWLYSVDDKHDPRVIEVNNDGSKDFKKHVLLQ